MSSVFASQLPNAPRPPITDASRGPLDRTAKLSMRTRTYTARTISECLQMAKQEMGVEAMIVSKRTFKRGALFGRWGGKEMVEVTFGTYRPAPVVSEAPSSIIFSHGAPTPGPAHEERETAHHPSSMQKLEAQIAGLTESVQNLLENGNGKSKRPSNAFVSSPVEARTLGSDGTEESPAAPVAPKAPRRPRAKTAAEMAAAQTSEAGPYPTLMRQLLDADVAAPVARQMLADVPEGMPVPDAAAALRTVIAHRLKIASGSRPASGTGMRLIAFVGTTGVGKTTTIAKLAAQYAIRERRRVGIVTLDTHRIAAAQQLQTYGQILKVPVMIAHDKTELCGHLDDFRNQGLDVVLIDTAGRSPNDMMPLGEAGDLFEGLGPVQKYLAIPATLAARDMDHIVTRFQASVNPDALVLTKLDEATDSSCFGKLLTIQAKSGIPLAYVTTGQKVPDDITCPDAHAIAARILTTAVL